MHKIQVPSKLKSCKLHLSGYKFHKIQKIFDALSNKLNLRHEIFVT